MTRFGRAMAVAVAASFILSVTGTVPAAAAEPALGAVFNSSDKWAISKRISAMILAAPAGSAIRAAMFRVKSDDPYIIPALQSALLKGVKVKIVVDKSGENPNPLADGDASTHDGLAGLNEQIRLKMGSANNPANDSYLVTCNSGCIGDNVMHNKFFLFSTMGTKKEVTFLSTSNSDRESTTAWQAAYSVAGGSAFYGGFKDYFEDLANRRVNPDYYRTFADGIYKAYIFPRASSTSSSSDPSTDTIYNILDDNVKCSGNSSGVKSDTLTNATMIRIAMWGFTRVEVAKKILALAKQGCRFDIVVNDSDEFPSAVRAQLHHANINVDNAYRPLVSNVPTWMHAKYMLIDGNYAGNPDTKIVFFGSHNFTINALRHNDEYWVKISSGSVHDQFVENFRTIINSVDNMPGFHA